MSVMIESTSFLFSVDTRRYFPGVKFDRQPELKVSYEFNHATLQTFVTAILAPEGIFNRLLPAAIIPEIQAAAENNAASTFLEDQDEKPLAQTLMDVIKWSFKYQNILL